MSFGWSAGDIAQGLVIVTKAVKALNDVDGAPAHYRDAVSFLTDLKMTLEALKVESAGLDPRYVDEIRKQVQKIRIPIGEFSTMTTGYEASLGTTVAIVRHAESTFLFLKLPRDIKNLSLHLKTVRTQRCNSLPRPEVPENEPPNQKPITSAPSTKPDENIELRQTSTADKITGDQVRAKLPQA